MAHSNMTSSELTVYTNAFPIHFSQLPELEYRIWNVSPVPKTPELRNKISTHLWKRGLRKPVVPIYHDDQFAYAVADSSLTNPTDYTAEGNIRYIVSPSDEVRAIQIEDMTEAESELAVAMFQWDLQRYFENHPNLASGHSRYQFFEITPDIPYQKRKTTHRQPSSKRTEPVDIFRGFTFRIIHISDVGLCAVIDVRTTYIGKNSLATYLRQSRTPSHIEKGNAFGKSYERWVYDYGRQKKPVYLVEVTDKTIGQTTLKDGTAYDYLRDNYPHLRRQIAHSDKAANIVYSLDAVNDEGKYYTAAATLLKPKFGYGSRPVRALGDNAAFPPNERLRRSKIFRDYFSEAKFAGQQIELGEPHQQERSVFSLPKLRYGPDSAPAILNADEIGTTEWDKQRFWGDKKLEYLQSYGPYIKKPFRNPYFVYPADFEEQDLLDVFLQKTQNFCQSYGKVDFNPEFESYRDNAHARDIVAKLKAIESNQNAGFILLALPTNPDTASRVYTGAKSQLKIPSKCFSASKAKQMAKKSNLTAYVQGNTLAMLVENEAALWGLADGLTHDLIFGFDVARTEHGGLMGATIITEKIGAPVTFYYAEIPTRERIPSKTIGSLILEHLNAFFERNEQAPDNISIQRDGKLPDSDFKGIQTAFRKFAENHPEEPPLKWGVVTIQKNHMVPMRLFRNYRGAIQKPLAGSVFMQNPNAGFLATTGGATQQLGTPNPIQIELTHKSQNYSTDFNNILRDIFWLSQLNWNSPKINTQLPITIRFTDHKLERFALELDDLFDDDDWD